MTATAFLQHIPRGRLARNTLLTIGWQGIRIFCQLIWVVLLARAIGPGRYGAFSGIAGLATAMGALTGLGFGVLMLQDASRDHLLFSSAWKRALWMTLVSGVFLWAVYCLGAPMLFGIPTSVLLYAAIGLPELVCFPLTIVSSYAFQLHERLGWAGALHTFIPIGNLIAVCTFLCTMSRQTLGTYVPFHAAASVLAVAGGLLLVRRLLSPSRTRLSITGRDAREALGFSLMRVADTSMTSLDKTLVLALAGSEVAGIYSSAYRLVSVLTVPATSLGVAALPRLFRAHAENASDHARLVRSLCIATIAYGVVAALVIWPLATVLPMLLGPAFSSAAQGARLLILFPLVHGLYTLGCTVLVTSERRTFRLTAQLLGIALLAIFAFVCLPRFGLAGAASMLICATAATALMAWFLASRYSAGNSRLG